MEPLLRLVGLGVVLVTGCGGKAVVDGFAGEGGAITTTSSTTSGTSASITTTTTATTTSFCTSHDQCGGRLCVFSTGLCADACSMWEPCGLGWYCSDCATSSCPGCDDCVSACLPTGGERCDQHDDCPGQHLCLFWQQQCAPPCTPEGGCLDPGLWCNGCATSSCADCADCLAACVRYEWDD